MTTDNTRLADIYDAAANYIERNGHYQGHFFRPDLILQTDSFEIIPMCKEAAEKFAPPMCAMGAISAAAEDGDEYTAAHNFLARSLGQTRFPSVPDWNDAPSRTKEDVIYALRKASFDIRMGNIGDNPREYEFEPMPTTQPVHEPAAPQPVKEPQPA